MKIRTSALTGVVVASMVVMAVGATVVGHEGNGNTNMIHACVIKDGHGSPGLLGEIDQAPANPSFKCPSGSVALHWAKQGPKGATGARGAAGADGQQGPKGDTGEGKGPQGDTGEKGDPGKDGKDGKDGTDGTNGQDGSVGPQGATGPQGDPGKDGKDGTNGTDGATGATGPQGQAGTNGTDGATGATGPQGPAGSNGANGATGPQGATGATGASGSNGATGATGPQGATGPAGAAQTATYKRLQNATNDNTITIDCGTGNHAVGGGGQGDTSLSLGGSHLESAYPSNSSGTAVSNNATNSQYWTVTFGGTSTAHIGWAVCVPN